MKKLYVDTNIFLDYYRANVEKDVLLIFKKLALCKTQLLTTRQTVKEFERNRDNILNGVIKDFINKTKTEKFSSDALYLFGEFKEYTVAYDNLVAAAGKTRNRLKAILEDKSKDKIYQNFFKLWSVKNTLECDDEIIDKAWKRKITGNPPTSDGITCCDEVIWETLLWYGRRNNNDLVFVTGDGTFKNNFNYLAREYEKETGGKFEVYPTVTKGLEALGEEVSEELKGIEDDLTWVDITKRALKNIGGVGFLKDIYEEAENLLYLNDLEDKTGNRDKEATIRGVLQRYSKESDHYIGKADLFEQISKGVWKLK